MSSNELTAKDNRVEIRFFGLLRKYANEQDWSSPYIYELKEECSALDLAAAIGLPEDLVEGVFVNGIAKPVDDGWVKPGDRVGFVPYGVPGPYRMLLGIRKNQQKPSSTS